MNIRKYDFIYARIRKYDSTFVRIKRNVRRFFAKDAHQSDLKGLICKFKKLKRALGKNKSDIDNQLQRLDDYLVDLWASNNSPLKINKKGDLQMIDGTFDKTWDHIRSMIAVTNHIENECIGNLEKRIKELERKKEVIEKAMKK